MGNKNCFSDCDKISEFQVNHASTQTHSSEENVKSDISQSYYSIQDHKKTKQQSKHHINFSAPKNLNTLPEESHDLSFQESESNNHNQIFQDDHQNDYIFEDNLPNFNNDFQFENLKNLSETNKINMKTQKNVSARKNPDNTQNQIETIIIDLTNANYEGESKNGKKHGKGTLILQDQSEGYEGSFLNDLFHGYGIYFNKEQRYEGFWKYGKKCGMGLEKYNDGSTYYGNFKNNVKNGYGKFTYANGDIYVGDLENNYYSGKGSLKTISGKLYEGDWLYSQQHGIGKMIYANGKLYKGSFKCGKRDGHGEMIWPNGKIYKGQWKDGKMNGDGTFISNNKVYQGRFVNNKLVCDKKQPVSYLKCK